VLGLTQTRIKRLFAYSTISHVGFILLGLSINSIESIQAFMFFLLQYSLSNLNAFILLLSIGYLLYFYFYNNEGEYKDLKEKNYSPIQYINQLKGYFYLNPLLAICLSITLFSFIGVPPLLGFFGKQMILSAALDNGYIFMSLIAIITSVIGACYYLVIIKQIYFYKPDYVFNSEDKNLTGYLIPYSFEKTGNINDSSEEHTNNTDLEEIKFNLENITLSSYLAITVSILTNIILLFILMPNELFTLSTNLTLVLFN
jgi:NADH-ubiquinone oxidoreductase chain 2